MDGINFLYDEENINYWDQLGDDFKANVPTSEVADSYTSWRPTKLNAALKYSFGDIRSKICYTATRKNYYYNANLHAFIEAKHKKKYTLGQEVIVSIQAINLFKRTMDLAMSD